MSKFNDNSKAMRGVIRILMQSPIYLRMPLAERKILVQKLCAQMELSSDATSSQVHDSASPTVSTAEDISSRTVYHPSDLK
jgi:hypothetical protein